MMSQSWNESYVQIVRPAESKVDRIPYRLALLLLRVESFSLPLPLSSLDLSFSFASSILLAVPALIQRRLIMARCVLKYVGRTVS